MPAALCVVGWRAHTLHLRDDGLLVGAVEVSDLDAARAAMRQSDVNARWQKRMAPCFVGPSNTTPGRDPTVLETVLDLDAHQQRDAYSEETTL